MKDEIGTLSMSISEFTGEKEHFRATAASRDGLLAGPARKTGTNITRNLPRDMHGTWDQTSEQGAVSGLLCVFVFDCVCLRTRVTEEKLTASGYEFIL